MKLTKKLEQEVLKVYNEGWEAYLRGDLKTHASCLSSKFKIIGTTEAEHFSSKKAWLAFCKKTMHQVVGVAELRNRRINLDAVGNGVMVVENSAIYVLLAGKWQFYSKIRITALLQKEKTGWKYVHQHGSLPDMRASEDETIAAKQIKKENQQLREAVKRRTIELEEKNRELEIEASLEKVRAQALGMRKSEDLLEICRTLYKELGSLGITSLRNAVIHVFHDERACFTDYEYSDETGGHSTMVPYKGDVTIEKFIKRIRKSENAFVELRVKGQELTSWKSFRKKTGQIKDHRLKQAKAIHYYIYSAGIASIGISSFDAIDNDKKELLKRFRNVFDFAYRRYTDITLAYAQAREAQIESALERVRAASLAMHKADELLQVATVMRTEMAALGVEELETSSIYTMLDNDKAECWYAIKDVRGKNSTLVFDEMTINLKATYVGRQMLKFFKSTTPQTSILMRGEQRKEWINYCASCSGVLKGYYGSEIPERTYHLVKFSHGYVGAATPGSISNESWSLLQRMTAVFSLAYTRFLDLQKAEKQAREAHIEVAVERVRARALAMHKSSEISALANTLRHELVGLNIPGVAAATICLKQEDGTIRSWDITSTIEYEDEFHFNLDFVFNLAGTQPTDWIRRIWDPKRKYFVIEQDEADIHRTIAWTRKYNSAFADTAHRFLTENNIKQVWHPVVSLEYGKLSLDMFQPPPAETEPILIKMGAAFDLAYKRFLDLQKAEAQAREAQIEAALERVRSRSLSMKNSEELKEVVAVLFKQLQELNFGMDQGAAIVMTFSPDSEDHTQWITDASQSYPVPFFIPFTPHSVSRDQSNARKRGLSFLSKVYSQKEKNDYFKHLFQFTQYKQLPKEVKTVILKSKLFGISIAFENHSAIAVPSTVGKLVSGNEIEILKRFAKVFEQCYTRFLDLQKAEAQAREAQIEASLERIRAKAMAIRKSEEWKDIIRVVFQEWNKLGVSPYECSINIIDRETRVLTNWATGSTGESDALTCYTISPWNHSILNDFYRDFFEGKKYRTDYLTGKRWSSYLDGLFTHSDFKDAPKAYKDQLYAVKSIHVSHANNYHTSLDLFDFEPLPEDKAEVMVRIAAVVEMAYTRYLDIKTAEAQAREAQIEVAVERVRAKALAMHKSEEIMSVIKSLRQELDGLRIPGVVGTTIYLKQDDGRIRFWDITTLEEHEDGVHFTMDKYLRLEECPDFLWFQRLFRQEDKYLIVGQHEEELKRSLEWIRHSINEEVALSMIAFFEESGSWHLWHPRVLLENGVMNIDFIQPPPAEAEPILIKMGAAFDLAYKRFLDLQKAEVQARDAQIETALERVRSKTMAMHASQDLLQVTEVLSEQLKQLGILRDAVSFLTDNSEAGYNMWLASPEDKLLTKFFIPRIQDKVTLLYKEALAAGKDYYIYTLNQEEKNVYFRNFFENTAMKMYPEEQRQLVYDSPGMAATIIILDNITLSVSNFSAVPYNDSDVAIIKRFAAVFQQSYTRFLDLQKAEAQAREAQIEAALERVRSRSLAMHKSDELNEVVTVLFEKLNDLSIPVSAVGISIKIEGSKDLYNYTCGQVEGGIAINNYRLPYFNHRIANDFFEAREKQLDFFVGNYSKQEKDSFYEYVIEHTKLKSELMEDIKQFIFQSPSYSISVVTTKHTMITLNDFEGKSLSADEIDILKRFSKVFEQAYTRFLDLQKAEAQAHEAQIEAALERVRAQAMAMHHSEDLGKTIQVYYEQLDELIDSTIVRCGAGLLNKENTIAEMSTASKSPDGVIYHVKGTIDMHGHPLLESTYEHWLKQKEYSHVLRGNEIKEYYQYITNQVAIPENSGDDELYFYFPMFNEGSFYMVANSAVPENELQIFRRFSSVLSLTYKRFNDLQKAEAQARESQIEAALERVRSYSMAMQKSQDLTEVIGILYAEMKKLDAQLDRAFIMTFDPLTLNSRWWMASGDNVDYHSGLLVQYHEYAPFLAIVNAWKNRIERWNYILEGREKKEWDSFIFYNTELRLLPEVVKENMMRFETAYFTSSNQNFGCLLTGSYQPLGQEAFELLVRFAKVFEQTYTRFLDLKRAETQAREAQIEAALERVRAQTMAMHSSDDVGKCVIKMFSELTALGVHEGTRFGIGILNHDNENIQLWTARKDEEEINMHIGSLDMNGHPLLKSARKAWLAQLPLHQYVLQGEDLVNYYQMIKHAPDYKLQVAIEKLPEKEFHYGFVFEHGFFYAFSHHEFQTDLIHITQRFSSLFGQTYQRYLDLVKAEAQAREAIKRASVDRVRAEIASMRTTSDLDHITPLIWRELTTLGITFVRCGVFIMEEERQVAQGFLSTPDGKAIAAFQLPYSAVSMPEAVEYWRKKKMYSDHWARGESEFSSLADILASQGAIPNREQYLSTVPQEGIYLYYLPFLQGVLYVGHTQALSEDDLNLIQSVADAFSTAYARYEDFNKLETAKKTVENTLSDLRQTQQQLVQSEKMASLGELTAGIAHEIQNPLNFVNNFSEVSNELLDEMTEELRKGAIEEAQAIANDVKQNLEKILHHGKRADGIVKGMLQHSRTSSGTKEPTDLNALTDEYLRLAYHGLRAKDKTFNAKFETHFDESIEKIEVVPQDIGRVILNLITNAFYVVAEKKRKYPEGYEPKVIVSSKKVDSKVELRVKDNGLGIPDNIKEKIFQPFFTTKPTGQGTGLGLSLSYDIVKAHGGELKVETKEGERSEFIISLPLV